VTSTPSTTVPPPSGTFAVVVKTSGSVELAGADPGGLGGAGDAFSPAHAEMENGRAKPTAAAPRTARRDTKGSGVAAVAPWGVTAGPPSNTGVPAMRSECQTVATPIKRGVVLQYNEAIDAFGILTTLTFFLPGKPWFKALARIVSATPSG
jgi:hypothetical protein